MNKKFIMWICCWSGRAPPPPPPQPPSKPKPSLSPSSFATRGGGGGGGGGKGNEEEEEHSLRKSEHALLTGVLKNKDIDYHGCFIDIGQIINNNNNNNDNNSESCRVWTLIFNQHSTNTPLVLLHGNGSGVGWWCLNYEQLARDRPVYAIDMIGFGQSSRYNFSNDPIQIEQELVTSVELWRQQVLNDKKIILLGYSLGAFIATSYTMKHPRVIKHLILANPWGFPEPSATSGVYGAYNPFLLRGPFGLRLFRTLCSDISRKFSTSAAADYLYQCVTAKKPTGEVAFKRLGYERATTAKYPMMARMLRVCENQQKYTYTYFCPLKRDIPITIIYGERSSNGIDNQIRSGFRLKQLRKKSHVNVEIISGAGYHVNIEAVEEFNSLVKQVGNAVDETNPP